MRNQLSAVALLLGLALVTVQAPGLSFSHDAVPELPFPSEQDPLLCGLPQALGAGVTGRVDGYFRGELVEPEVHLYDSHLRRKVVGHLPNGALVIVTMFQDNPVLDFYFVTAETDAGTLKGWIPEEYLDLD